MADPDIHKNIEVRGELNGSPLLERAFWNWYLPNSKDKTRPAQHLRDKWSDRIVAEPHWGYEPEDVHSLHVQLPRVGPIPFDCRVNLNHWDISLSTGPKTIGHWDEARWCPFALRWDEVHALVEHGEGSRARSVTLLLLSPFVASTEPAEIPVRREAATRAFEALDIEPKRIARRAVPPLPEAHRWAYDDHRGLLLEGEYLGYTLRRCDDGAPSALFPWTELRVLRSELGLAERPDGVPDHVHHRPDEPVSKAPLVSAHPLDGASVVHPKLGAGLVVAVDAMTGAERATVRFDDGSERTLLTRFLRARDDDPRGDA